MFILQGTLATQAEYSNITGGYKMQQIPTKAHACRYQSSHLKDGLYIDIYFNTLIVLMCQSNHSGFKKQPVRC